MDLGQKKKRNEFTFGGIFEGNSGNLFESATGQNWIVEGRQIFHEKIEAFGTLEGGNIVWWSRDQVEQTFDKLLVVVRHSVSKFKQ